MTAPFLPGQIEHWPVARLKPYARNAKTHDPDQVAKIAASNKVRAFRATETDACHRLTSSFSIATARHKNRKTPSHPNIGRIEHRVTLAPQITLEQSVEVATKFP